MYTSQIQVFLLNKIVFFLTTLNVLLVKLNIKKKYLIIRYHFKNTQRELTNCLIENIWFEI